MTPPSHLASAGRAFFARVAEIYDEFDPQEQALLILACEQLDIVAQCRNRIRREGMIVHTKPHNNAQPHPALAVSRQAMRVFSQLVGQPGLPSEDQLPRGGKRPRYGSARVARAKAAV